MNRVLEPCQVFRPSEGPVHSEDIPGSYQHIGPGHLLKLSYSLILFVPPNHLLRILERSIILAEFNITGGTIIKYTKVIGSSDI
jgi:hypothetical protein